MLSANIARAAKKVRYGTGDQEQEDEALTRARTTVDFPPGTPLQFRYDESLDLLTIWVGPRDRKESQVNMRAGETTYRDFAGQAIRIQVRRASETFPPDWLERHKEQAGSGDD